MIIWLASYPRSGNNLFANLIKHHLRIPVYSFYDKEIRYPYYEILLDKVLDTDNPFYLSPEELENAKESEKLFIVKTHELPEAGNQAPAIYLVRDGRDVMVSYAHYILNDQRNVPESIPENPFEWAMDTLINSSDQFGGWGPHVDTWVNRPAKTVTIRFEDLIHPDHHLSILQSTLREIGFEQTIKIVDPTPLPSFNSYHSKTPILFRKGKTGSWITEMSTEYHLRFWDRYGDAMQKMGYKNNADQLAIQRDFALKELLVSKNMQSFVQPDQELMKELIAKERVIQEIHQANQRLTDELIAKEQVIQEIHQANQKLTDELIAKEQVIQEIHQANQKLTDDLATKKQIIREFQQTFAYRFQKSMSGFRKHSS